ncbi:UbiX family flavin prenyltransferase [Candidatus Bathyarchaeota archaeon]|nr:UbiX family flavin prenyltransferase [Candidatus Bathyarchaeota archaeon]
MRLIVGLSGASGIIYGVRLLQELKAKSVETHLVISHAAEKLIPHEIDLSLDAVGKLATFLYDVDDMFARIASGSFPTNGMAVIPCSMKTMAGICSGYADNLLIRTAMVTLKEGRKLVLVPRETPLSPVDLENMLKLSRIGVMILPAMPAFYHDPKNIDDLVAYIVGKTLDAFSIEHSLFRRWGYPDLE